MEKKKQIKLLPIAFDCSDVELSMWMDEWKVVAFGENSLNPERYCITSDNGRYFLNLKQDYELHNEMRLQERVLELLCRIRLINRQLKGKMNGICNYLSYAEAKEAESQRDKYYEEYRDIVNSTLKKGNTSTIPPELETQKAKSIFKKAIKAGLITSTPAGYSWNKSKALCAYFCECFSDYMKLSKREVGATCWKPFEQIFNYKNLAGCKNEYKNKTGNFPKDYELIDEIFK